MSGYYPSLHDVADNNYPNNLAQPPPPLSINGDYPFHGSRYETDPSSTRFDNNNSTSGYGVNQLPGGSNIYPSTSSYQPSQVSHVEEALPLASGGLYPSLDTPAPPSNHGVSDHAIVVSLISLFIFF